MESKAYASLEGIFESVTFNADGCTTYSIYNAGNCNLSIDGLVVIKPLGTWDGPPVIANTKYYGKHKIEFDLVTPVTFKSPLPGAAPASTVVLPGDPAPPRDARAIVMRINVK